MSTPPTSMPTSTVENSKDWIEANANNTIVNGQFNINSMHVPEKSMLIIFFSLSSLSIFFESFFPSRVKIGNFTPEKFNEFFLSSADSKYPSSSLNDIDKFEQKSVDKKINWPSDVEENHAGKLK